MSDRTHRYYITPGLDYKNSKWKRMRTNILSLKEEIEEKEDKQRHIACNEIYHFLDDISEGMYWYNELFEKPRGEKNNEEDE
tara:strand:+ start:16 stop:261 length:246 start_codon:yes stop_codon:yes gene_type:complete